jgi:hypothetical protein
VRRKLTEVLQLRRQSISHHLPEPSYSAEARWCVSVSVCVCVVFFSRSLALPLAISHTFYSRGLSVSRPVARLPCSSTSYYCHRPSKSLVAQSLDTSHHPKRQVRIDIYCSALDPSHFWVLLKCEPPSRLAAGTLLATAHPALLTRRRCLRGGRPSLCPKEGGFRIVSVVVAAVSGSWFILN